MPIEGPLRELGVHDVFQLLDLTRKTGSLRVRSALRANDGVVHFLNGRVVGATMRDDSHKLGHMLVQAGRVTDGELRAALEIRASLNEAKRVGEILVSMGAMIDVAGISAWNLTMGPKHPKMAAAGLWTMTAFRAYLAIHNQMNERRSERR